MITINANLREPIFLRHAGEENALRVAFDLQEFEAHWPGGVPARLVRRPISSMDAAAYPVPLSVDGRTAFWTVSASDTEHSGYGKAQLQWRVGGTLAKSCVYDTVCAPSLLAGDAPPDAPSKAWFDAIQGQIGDLSKLTTEAKENLVAAINEAARTGGGSGGAGPIDMRVANGYIQYSNDGGETWENLIAVEDLKGDKGETGPKGEQGPKGDPGAKGADGITPTIGANGNWYLGDIDTQKPSRGEKGADGAAGKDGYSPEATVTPINGGAKIIIKDRNGTTSANVMIGAQGPKGDKGDPGATDLSLGITGAHVGQIAKITAVDASGKPTKWEPVDMPSGGGGETWVKVYDGSNTIAEEISVFEVDLTKSDPMKEFQLWLKLDKNTAADWGATKNIRVTVNGEEAGYFIFQHRLNTYVEFYEERSLEAMTVAKRCINHVQLNYNVTSPFWMVEQGVKQQNNGKLSISFPAPYAGKITAKVYGRY